MKKWILIFVICLSFSSLFAQQGILNGKVRDAISNEAISYATVRIQQTQLGTQTDSTGSFIFRSLKPGLYNLEVSFVGYVKKVVYEIAVDNAKASFIDIRLEKSTISKKELTISTKQRKDKTEESPLSLRNIGVNEIQRNPGGNRDISKVIQSLPGVGSSVGYRNDLIIRGGGPSENRFYLDGIEIPNINHFATQGANGGPVGMLNVDFLQDVSYYAGAFPSNRGNLLSSLLEFNMKNPRTDKWHAAFTLGSSDMGIRTEGPLSKKSGLMLSVRRSYLKYLFTALELPFLPTYNDVQLKYKFNINAKNELTYLLLGAYDQSVLNLNSNKTEAQQYILGYLPAQTQWNYTNGIVYKHYRSNSFQTWVVSRNMLDNRFVKHQQNNTDLPLTYDYRSQEIENKFRFEHTARKQSWKFNAGIAAESVKYNNRTYNIISLPNATVDTLSYHSDLAFLKYALFAQLSRRFWNEQLTLSAGLRMDANTYSAAMKNLFEQTSPRISASWKLNDRLTWNANSGRYFQLPSYTILGYRDAQGKLMNQNSQVHFMQNTHVVSGFEYSLPSNVRFTIEGFYKKYNRYPQSIRTGLSLANTGGDFGVVGDEAMQSVSTGRAYGLEFFAQQKLYKGFYGLLAITLFRSEFSNANQQGLSPSSWDQRLIVNLTAGKKIKRNWELGAKFRFTGGRPYTPYDTSLSSQAALWDVTQSGQFDYTRVNQSRLPVNHQLDIRIDKKYFFKHWNLNLYFDIQNAYAFAAKEQDILTVQRNAQGQPIVDPNSTSPQRYLMKYLPSSNGTVLPTLGVIIEY